MAIALLLAAGLGERLGLGRPKALAELAGRPLWRWSADVLLACPEISRVVLAVPEGSSEGELQACSEGERLVAVRGGAVRSESVLLALRNGAKGGVGVDSDDPDSLVLVHDAARPLLTAGIVAATLAACAADRVDAAIAATPVTDTIKQADGDGRVVSTLDRAGLWAVQTPQVFRRGVLERALDVGADVLAQATDDAWLIERMGGSVVVVPTPRENLKVTTPVDMELAELLLARRDPATAA